MTKNSESENLEQYNRILDLMQTNEFEQAFSEAKKIMDEVFDPLNYKENTLRFYNNFLWLCFKLEKYNEGSLWADKLQEVARENPYIYHHAACLYVKTGQLDKAIQQLKLAHKYRYPKIEDMLSDTDLEPLFTNKEFQLIKNKPLLTREVLKKIIFEAFKNVSKGEGLGVRECIAEDDWASEEEKKRVRFLDVEQYWWEYPKDLIDAPSLGYALNYNNKDGVKFHLPALMTLDIIMIDNIGIGHTVDISIIFTLCLENFKQRPHHGHREYVDFMRSIDVTQIIKYYNFTPAQVRAIALYFLFKDDLYSIPREEVMETIKDSHERSKKYGGGSKNYNLTLDDAIAIKDEEQRIFTNWFKAGEVNFDDFIILN